MNNLAIVGTFNDKGGRPSTIGTLLTTALRWPHINGGCVKLLSKLDPQFYDAILWMPDIPNSHPKELPRLKAVNRKLVLISSKRCDGKYNNADVVGRLLKSHSNLGVAIYGDEAPYYFHLLDPLGNIYCKTWEVGELARAIQNRLKELTCITRYASRKVGPAHPFEVNPDFLAIVQLFGCRFAGYVNAINPNRFLGNAATRCAFGFPAERREDTILVSRRDVPKDTIASGDFVEVIKQENTVSYWGDQKPSVDAPIQLLLFERYKKIRYVIHGHVWVAGAPMTEHKYPCGAIEEFQEISKLVPDSLDAFSVNLRGHGCLMACADLSYFETRELVARPFPED